MADRPDDSGSKAKAGELMATYYVGIGGNDSNDGLSWAQRKLTLGGAEALVAAGDIVYIGAGTYREKLICGVSGSIGAPITYIGDYDGSHTDGTGGVVRVTASNDDLVSARNICIDANGKDHRTFKGFTLDGSGSIYATIWAASDIHNWIIDSCYFDWGSTAIKFYTNSSPYDTLITNCFFVNCAGYTSTTVRDNVNLTISNCIFLVSQTAITIKEGNSTIKNCSFYGGYRAVNCATLNAGQYVTVNNCDIGITNHYALVGASIVEDYNRVSSRSGTPVGSHSVSSFSFNDTRWYHEMMNGGSMLTPFDIAGYNGLIDVAGTSPTTTDMRGTTVQGTQREWGALEYDSTLDIEAGSGGGGGAVSIQPLSGRLGL